MSRLKSIITWSGLCKHKREDANVRPFYFYQYIQISQRNNSILYRSSSSVFCEVELESDEDLASICFSRDANQTGFIKRVLDLCGTPPTSISLPSGKSNVTKRFETVEGRINITARMKELYELQDYVFRARTEQFYYILATCVETFSNLYLQMNKADVETVEETNQLDHDFMKFDDGDLGLQGDADEGSFDYDLDLFVAVRADGMNAAVRAWIGKIVSVEKNSEGRI